jgi:hypothetical protein
LNKSGLINVSLWHYRLLLNRICLFEVTWVTGQRSVRTV